jgi:hypothetical protein
MGLYSRFVADDYGSAAGATSKGLIKATLDSYFQWSGRFSASFFDGVFGLLGNKFLPYVTGTSIIIWMFALIANIKLFFRQYSKNIRYTYSFLFSALLLITTFELSPSLGQSLYWGQGMRSLVFPLIVGTFLSAVLIYSLYSHQKITWTNLTIVGLLSFVAGGFGETYVAIQTLVLFFVLFLILGEDPGIKKKDALILVITGLTFSIIAMAITIIAPGNKFRQEFYPPSPDLFNLLRISFLAFLDFLNYLVSSLYRWSITLVLLISSLLLGTTLNSQGVEEKNSTRNNKISNFLVGSFPKIYLSVIAISLIIIFGCFLPSAYGMSSHPSGRTLIIPLYVFSITISLIGFLTGRRYRNEIRNFIQSHSLGKLAQYFALVLLMLFSIYSYTTSERILADQPKYRHFAEVFDVAEMRIHDAKSEGATSVPIRLVHNLFELDDFGNGDDWVHNSVNQYYGLNIIVHWIE